MKKFLIKFSYIVLPIYILMLGLVAYVTLYISPRADSDLGSLALIPFGVEYSQSLMKYGMKDTLFIKINHTEELRNIHVNVLTVGDSFSQQGNIGYQNYMPGEGLTVANCRRSLYENPLQYACNILDWGVVDSTNIDVLVVEVVERDFALRISDFKESKVEVPEPESAPGGEKRNANEWSLLRARDFILYRFAGRSPVYVVDLNRDFFSSREPNKLYFYDGDIKNGLTIDEAVVPKMKNVFEVLTRKAHERGIRLMLMVAVDKYDLYQDYITDNPYPPKRVNEDIREIFGDIPEVMLCKYCLQPLVEKGEKDVFLFDNTHWSYKGSEAVGKELSRRVIPLLSRRGARRVGWSDPPPNSQTADTFPSIGQ